MDLLTTKEAAAILRLCPQSVRTLCDQKRIACIRHNPNGKRLIPRKAIEDYLASLSDSVETYVPAIVQFDDIEKRFKERTARLKRAK